MLVEIDGQPIRARDDITARLRARAPDGELEITVIDRWGQERKRVWRPDAASPDKARTDDSVQDPPATPARPKQI